MPQFSARFSLCSSGSVLKVSAPFEHQ